MGNTRANDEVGTAPTSCVHEMLKIIHVSRSYLRLPIPPSQGPRSLLMSLEAKPEPRKHLYRVSSNKDFKAVFFCDFLIRRLYCGIHAICLQKLALTTCASRDLTIRGMTGTRLSLQFCFADRWVAPALFDGLKRRVRWINNSARPYSHLSHQPFLSDLALQRSERPPMSDHLTPEAALSRNEA